MLQRGVLLRNGRPVLARISSLIPKLLYESHDSTIRGHSGFLRTYKQVLQNSYWPGVKARVKAYVGECGVYFSITRQKICLTSLLQHLPIPEKIWEELLMDFIEGLPLVSRFNTILVVVDRLSKYAYFSALKHPFTVADVSQIFVRDVVKLHGVPNTLLSDRDWIFLSTFWQELFRLQGTVLHRSTYHPQTDTILRPRPPTLIRYEASARTEGNAQLKMKQWADKKRRTMDFTSGDWLPPQSPIHPVFHVSQLKPTKGGQQYIHNLSYSTMRTRLEVLVKWRDLPTTESTWEPTKRIFHAFLEFLLADKVPLFVNNSSRMDDSLSSYVKKNTERDGERGGENERQED
ncbi:unnamed protein product [Spirodela intermedia]|uniref:Integrase catalytic domain-containing protein n=1 Tax=Spirodela intermedia TaxID=51605 RepID=A0A7I8K8J7_SPIIN|nr:unnamed protein product [Spirodela intermedia]